MTQKQDPIHQFEVHKLIDIHMGSIDLSFTNVAVFMILIVALSCFLLWLASSRCRMVPTRLQSIAEIGYEFVASTLRDSAGTEGFRFFPFVFSCLFLFWLQIL